MIHRQRPNDQCSIAGRSGQARARIGARRQKIRTRPAHRSPPAHGAIDFPPDFSFAHGPRQRACFRLPHGANRGRLAEPQRGARPGPTPGQIRLQSPQRKPIHLRVDRETGKRIADPSVDIAISAQLCLGSGHEGSGGRLRQKQTFGHQPRQSPVNGIRMQTKDSTKRAGRGKPIARHQGARDDQRPESERNPIARLATRRAFHKRGQRERPNRRGPRRQPTTAAVDGLQRRMPPARNSFSRALSLHGTVRSPRHLKLARRRRSKGNQAGRSQRPTGPNGGVRRWVSGRIFLEAS